jgi:hypothetical protein
VRRYNTGTASTVYYQAGYARPDSSASESAAGAEAMLHAAVSNKSLGSMGLEGLVIEARAHMILGMMALDGDGSKQDDGEAFVCFERALRVAKKARAAPSKPAGGIGASSAHDYADDDDDDDDEAGCSSVMKYWDRSRGFGKRAYERRMRQSLLDVEADASESMQSMEGYMFFRNGRP